MFISLGPILWINIRILLSVNIDVGKIMASVSNSHMDDHAHQLVLVIIVFLLILLVLLFDSFLNLVGLDHFFVLIFALLGLITAGLLFILISFRSQRFLPLQLDCFLLFLKHLVNAVLLQVELVRELNFIV